MADTAHLSRVRCGLARDTWKPGWGPGMCEEGHGWFFKLVWATAVRVVGKDWVKLGMEHSTR